jgi:hypothetical protein
LFAVAGAECFLGACFGFGEGGKEHARKDGDDGDDDEEFDEGESAAAKNGEGKLAPEFVHTNGTDYGGTKQNSGDGVNPG